jgi:hypothetical protein
MQAKGKLQAEIQAHRKVAPTVHAHPNNANMQMLDKGKGEERKKAKFGLTTVWENCLLIG